MGSLCGMPVLEGLGLRFRVRFRVHCALNVHWVCEGAGVGEIETNDAAKG